MFGTKRKYNKKIIPRLHRHKDFLIRHLQKEWAEAEKATRKEDLIRSVKAGGIVLGKGLLVLLLLAGTLTVAAVAPNIFSIFGRTRGKRYYKTYIRRDVLQRELAILKKQKLVSTINIKNEYKIRLTNLGEKRTVQKVLNRFTIPIGNKWDGLWRIVIFDIPNKHKSAREGFREKLKAVGFHLLQKSVFVFPYPCEEELKFLASLYGVNQYIRLIETDHIIHDRDIKIHFGLAQSETQ